MAKIIRSTYPAEFSIGILILIFGIAGLLSHQIFDSAAYGPDEDEAIYFGMFLVSIAVVIMVLIMWEEILFPIKLKEVDGGMMFRNHRTKLKVQLFIYLSIPAIFTFIYLEYEVNHIRFWIWAAVCMVPPVLEKIFSGINNYNDFLRLTNEIIEYKNNELEGIYEVKTVKSVSIRKDEGKHIEKFDLVFVNGDTLVIDLDEMELEDFYFAIENYVETHYKHLLNA
ncbi:MAG: putative heavy metal rane efflux protein [Chitinophagaceae bacterium]|nr:putative heavy metal rane efflux protein [Chitinophagaceae bacterium]